MKKGAYGLTYQEVYLRDDLTIEAKAIYGMLCSYADVRTAEAYPSVQFMIDRLHIGRDRFYKHMGLLVAAGVVTRKTLREKNGAFSPCRYILSPNVEYCKKPITYNRNTENLNTENRNTDSIDTNNRTINNNTVNNRTSNSSIYCTEPEQSSTPCRTTGLLIPLVDGSFYDVPEADVEQWKKAYPAVNIEQEINKMIAWCNSNPTRRKTRKGVGRFINGWLTKEQDRGRYMAPEPEAKEPEDPNEEYRRYYAELGRMMGGDRNGSRSSQVDGVDDADLPFL